jgi:8-oxo-dGTP pyrophosphatase MutT (NUDIX family)
MAKKDASLADVILAAGGLVWRVARWGRQIAVVHRPKYDDWTLPKGKLDAGESWQDAAVREVEEETGFRVRLGDFAGGCAYLARRAPKVVLYWHMEVDGEAAFAPEDPAEVDALEWLSPARARRRLTYRHERDVLVEGAASAPYGGVRRRWLGGARAPAWVRRVAQLRPSSRSSSGKAE